MSSELPRLRIHVALLKTSAYQRSDQPGIGYTSRLPLELIYNRTGVLIAMTHVLLPFMILPIYSTLKDMPRNYLRAAASLGAKAQASSGRKPRRMCCP
ncbi:MAG: hypothetical protein ACKOD9_06530, partial [Rubrivivax sp.]